MRFTTSVLPLAALASAFVVPDEKLTRQLLVETQQDARGFFSKLADQTSQLVSQVEDAVVDLSKNAFDIAMHAAESVDNDYICHESVTAFDAQGWLDSASDFFGNPDILGGHHGKHGHHGHHGHNKPNKTVYQLINESKYTTTLASLINEYDDLVEALNGTAANYTVFAPTDKAFEKAMKHHDKPTKEQIKMILAYHVSADFYPAGRVLVTHTIPSTFGEPHIDGNRQRLRVGLGLRGLAVNFYSRIIAVNIFGTNGVIHGVDSVIVPPPQASKILSLLPGEFSTLVLALEKTGMLPDFEKEHFTGGTLFAPSNWAFQKLGPRINMFLFSEKGKKYLKALIEYHAVPKITLYSDAIYRYQEKDGEEETNGHIPKGKFQIDLPTVLKGKTIHVDIARFGGFIDMRLNGFNDVSRQDGIAKDGVLHELNSILLPPKTPGGIGMVVESEDDITLEELMERLDDHYEEL